MLEFFGSKHEVGQTDSKSARLFRTGRLGHIALYLPAKLRNGPVDPPEALAAAASARGDSLAALSGMLDRRSSYLSDFAREGVPRTLTERDQGLLSVYFGKSLGIRDLWSHV